MQQKPFDIGVTTSGPGCTVFRCSKNIDIGMTTSGPGCKCVFNAAETLTLVWPPPVQVVSVGLMQQKNTDVGMITSGPGRMCVFQCSKNIDIGMTTSGPGCTVFKCSKNIDIGMTTSGPGCKCVFNAAKTLTLVWPPPVRVVSVSLMQQKHCHWYLARVAMRLQSPLHCLLPGRKNTNKNNRITTTFVITIVLMIHDNQRNTTYAGTPNNL
jgi:hypothetical protein